MFRRGMCYNRNEDCWELGKLFPFYSNLSYLPYHLQVVHGLKECAIKTTHAQSMQTRECRLGLYLLTNWDTSKIEVTT